MENKAKWAADIIVELGLMEEFISAQNSGNSALVGEITEIALEEMGKKIEKMQTQYLTNVSTRTGFQSVVMGA